MTLPFGARLFNATAARGPLCVGIDPHPQLLDRWGLSQSAQGVEYFALSALDALGPEMAVLKPQSALFEQWGSAGIAVLERVLAHGRDAGALMLLDAKRGDIGSTMAGYARAYLTDGSPLAADALTVSPYLGFASLQPAIEAAQSSGRGLFVLCRTSNPHSEQVQLGADPETPGMTIAGRIASWAAELNQGASPRGNIGLVVGATVDTVGADLAVNGPLLAPGIGAQGAAPEDLPAIFGDSLSAVLPTASRSVLSAGPDQGALRDAAHRLRDQLAHVIRM